MCDLYFRNFRLQTIILPSIPYAIYANMSSPYNKLQMLFNHVSRNSADKQTVTKPRTINWYMKSFEMKKHFIVSQN
jgi:hypothetical protein